MEYFYDRTKESSRWNISSGDVVVNSEIPEDLVEIDNLKLSPISSCCVCEGNFVCSHS